jgi:VanZ family protein
MALTVPLLPSWLRWLGAVSVAGALLAASSLPGTSLPTAPSSDLSLHVLGYGGLTLSLVYATAAGGCRLPGRVLVVVTSAVLFGLGMELLQLTVPGRRFSSLDLLANGIGTLVACLWFQLEKVVEYDCRESGQLG